MTVPTTDRASSTETVTLIPVLYRDGDNYKAAATYVATGTLTQAQWSRLAQTLDDGLYFIPTQIGLAHLGPSLDAFPSDTDHIWHEMLLEDSGVEVLNRAAYAARRLDAIDIGPVEDFLTVMEAAARDGWDDTVTAAEVAAH